MQISFPDERKKERFPGSSNHSGGVCAVGVQPPRKQKEFDQAPQTETQVVAKFHFLPVIFEALLIHYYSCLKHRGNKRNFLYTFSL